MCPVYSCCFPIVVIGVRTEAVRWINNVMFYVKWIFSSFFPFHTQCYDRTVAIT